VVCSHAAQRLLLPVIDVVPDCGLTAQIGWFGLRVGGHPALSLQMNRVNSRNDYVMMTAP